MMMRRMTLVLCCGLVAACGDDSGTGNLNNDNGNGDTPIVCGNGLLETGEQCDDGEANSDTVVDACRTDCRESYCGDEVNDTPEACDDGDNGSDACPSTCLAPVCGDGHLLAGVEVCDDGNTADDDDCRADCGQDMTQCGDGSDDPGEQCDDGSANSDDTANACRQNCKLPVCGDDVADSNFGEQCDGDDLGGGTCATYNLDGGPLTCDASCMHVRTSCFGCGNDICEWGTGETDQPSEAGYCAVDCIELACDDAQDNDGDQLTDCDDASCDGRTCAPFGMECDGGTCECSGNSGSPQSAETAIDGIDNDCDGLVDCDDPDADGVSCGNHGQVCDINATGNRCVCSGNGAPPEATESTCDDGIDNDCDGAVGCSDSDCDGLTCGENGMVCDGSDCECSGNGGTIEFAETICTDQDDNDCDGLTDCDETVCENQPCRTFGGWTCQPDCPPPPALCQINPPQTCQCTFDPVPTAETDGTGSYPCGDGIDNDCDGMVDCWDSNCAGQPCALSKICKGLGVKTCQFDF